jgi:hypothetical protein
VISEKYIKSLLVQERNTEYPSEDIDSDFISQFGFMVLEGCISCPEEVTKLI